MNRLHNKIALVTGAGRGIGLAVAEAFLAEGAEVWITDADEGSARAAAERLGPRARALRLDVRSDADWRAAMEAVVRRHGRLDVLVNNAGITGLEEGRPHDPEHADLRDWRRVHETNLDGTFLSCQHALRTMRAARPSGAGGSIVNISSRSGLVGIPAAAAYASSKAAIRNHTKTVALYCAEQRLPVRCNSVHPAAILTPMWDPLLGTGEERERNLAAFSADTPLRRFGSPAEVAMAVVFLASDESAYMTGAELHIDGGILAGSAAVPMAES